MDRPAVRVRDRELVVASPTGAYLLLELVTSPRLQHDDGARVEVDGAATVVVFTSATLASYTTDSGRAVEIQGPPSRCDLSARAKSATAGERSTYSASVQQRRVDVRMDSRSANFVTTDRRYLDEAVAEMPTSANTPREVARLLARARQQFVLGGADYDNFADCLATAFKAVEVLLRNGLEEAATKKTTLGPLIERCRAAGLLTDYEHEYLSKFVLHFRNKLAHPDDVVAFTPGMSAECLTGCHRFVAGFCDRHYTVDLGPPPHMGEHVGDR